MNISFDNSAKVSGILTVVVEEADYKEKLEKSLKNYRKTLNIPGFRKGMAPMSIIKRQYEKPLMYDVINQAVGEQIYKYLKDNNLPVLGEPLPTNEKVDLEQPAPYTFTFDVALAPDLKAELTADDTIPYYNIEIEDKVLNDQIDLNASRSGKYSSADDYQTGDMIKGTITELDATGAAKENGISVEGAVLLPAYIKVEEQKNLFEGAKCGSAVTFNPKKAYPESVVEIKSLLKISEEQVADLTSDFSFQINEISRYTKAPIDSELFKSVFPNDEIADEATFRTKIAESLKPQFEANSDFRFITDVRKYLENKVGEVSYADDLMKRIMLSNNKDKDMSYVETNYAASVKELTWHLIKEQLVKANDIKLEQDDIKATAMEAARAQFAQYGMNNVPDAYLESYAEDIMKKSESIDYLVERTIDRKLTEVLKKVVTLDEKTVTFEDFNKMAAE